MNLDQQLVSQLMALLSLLVRQKMMAEKDIMVTQQVM